MLKHTQGGAATRERDERGAMPERHTVLVVDDEEAIRDACRQVLTKAGFDCHTAVDGLEGLHLAHQVQPDIVLLDLMMPGLSGYEVLDQLLNTHKHLVCIVITGYATIESAVEAMKHGAFDFLPKPFTPDELRLIVGRGLDQRKLLLETVALREEKERMKQYFITIVAHELRSPLLLVKQYLDLVVGGKMGLVDATAKELLSGAHGTLTGLLDIIADWLQLSRINAGDITGAMAEIAVAPILEKVARDLAPLAAERCITLRVEPADHDGRVDGHAESLEVVFRNLVTNAIKYNRPGGSVTMSTGAGQGNLRVAVSDTGMGIAKADVPFVFEDFFRVKSSKTAEIPGTGLGLSIVRKIVEGHHGAVTVESTEGEGTTFTVALPLAGAAGGTDEPVD